MGRARPRGGGLWRRTVAAVSVVVALSVAAEPAVAGDDYTWEQYEGCQDPKGTEAFVERFPDSARAAEGRACLERWKEEEDEWRKVADCGDVGRVESFLERYPEGRYAEQARECVARRRDSDVERLLAVCEMHFEADRLTEGVGGTAVECYREVQSRDPANVRAVQGLRRVFEKYVGWARDALSRGDAGKARGYAGKAGELSPEAPEVGALEEAVARLEQRQAERERLAREEEAKRERERAHGRKFRDCPDCPELVVVRSGSYLMGSESGDSDERPVHEVTIAEPFAVGVYEVTRGEFGRFVQQTGHSTGDRCRTYEGGEWKVLTCRTRHNPGFSQTDAHPVVCVSWEDARAYVRWLSGKTGEEYRLLSESEWEYVARAETETARYWGEGETGQCRHANGADRSAEREYSGWTVVGCDDGHVHTAPVGSFRANAFGLHDVLCNVYEWVQDCWNDSYEGAPSDGSAWESGDCSRRVLRGGSWSGRPQVLRSAYRDRIPAGFRDDDVGFRVARTLD